MMGLGGIVLPFYLYALWVTRKKGVGTVPESKLLKNVAVWSIMAPLLRNRTGLDLHRNGPPALRCGSEPSG